MTFVHSIKSLLIISGVILILLFANELLQAEETPSDKWILEWKEDFKTKKLNPSVWGYLIRRNGATRKFFTENSSCYQFKKGHLILKGMLNSPDNDSAKYLIGGISTYNKKSFPPGRFDIRAKIKTAQGMSAAIWLLPYNPADGWPRGGEIDIMEHVNHKDVISQTVHTSYTKKHLDSPPIRFKTTKVDYGEFNTYRVDILKDSLVFYVNNCPTFIYPKVDSLQDQGQYPFYKDWYLLINLNIDIEGYTGPVDDNELPGEMEIDWIRYYKAK